MNKLFDPYLFYVVFSFIIMLVCWYFIIRLLRSRRGQVKPGAEIVSKGAGSTIEIGRSHDKSDTLRVSKRSWPKKVLGILLVLLGGILTLQFLLTTWPSDIWHAIEGLAQDISLFGIGFFLMRLVISPGALVSIFILMMIGGIRLIQKQR